MLRARKALQAPLIVGWRERVDLPELGISLLVAKIDTGARNAALHAEHIEVQNHQVVFLVHGQTCMAVLRGMRSVKNSSGAVEHRPLIRTRINLGILSFHADVTLTNRLDMGSPMLLGRATIPARILVNPVRSFLFGAHAAVAQ